MCGIICYLGNVDLDIGIIESSVEKLRLRGPDNNNTQIIDTMNIMGFARLSINDVSEKGNQPLVDNDIYLICNGEIYNHKELREQYKLECKSDSDCEVIIKLYEIFGIEHIKEMINKLDGVFSFVLYDKITKRTIVARDPHGVRPLFFGKTKNNEIVICSEIKPISGYCEYIEPYKPGSYSIIGHNSRNIEFINYYNYSFPLNSIDTYEEIKKNVRHLLINAVDKRLMSDRPLGSLLSGGLDSSLITALVNRHYKPYELNTFSIGMKGSTDLFYAQKAADYMKTNHHNIELSNDDFLKAISEVIYMIESYDITTVRASVGNYLVGKYIKENTECKVIYNGDGSEEIMGSYLWFSNIDNESDFYDENYKLLREISYFDVLRSDRSISDNGLEPRVPFLDKKLVEYVMGIPAKYKMFGDGVIEKKLLREAFEDDKLLPTEVLWRNKEAFSDGVSSNEKSWFKIIQENLETMISDVQFEDSKNSFSHNTPHTKEALYYRLIFEEYFGNKANIIPHFWMPNPKWCNVSDPSARILKNYK